MLFPLIRRALFLTVLIWILPAWSADKNTANCLKALEAGKPKTALKIDIVSWEMDEDGELQPQSLDGKSFDTRLCRVELSLIYNVAPVNHDLYQGLIDQADTAAQRMVALAIGGFIERMQENGTASRKLMDQADDVAESDSSVAPAMRRRYEFYAALNDLLDDSETDFVRQVMQEFSRDLPVGHFYRFALHGRLADVLRITDQAGALALRSQVQDECLASNDLPDTACERNLAAMFASYRSLKLPDKAAAVIEDLAQWSTRRQRPAAGASAHALQALLHLDRQQWNEASKEAMLALTLMPEQSRNDNNPIHLLKLNLLMVDVLLYQNAADRALSQLQLLARTVASSATPEEVRLIYSAYSHVFLQRAHRGGADSPSLEQWHRLPLAGLNPELIKVWHDWTKTLLSSGSMPPRADVLKSAMLFATLDDEPRATLLRTQRLETAPGWTADTVGNAHTECVNVLTRSQAEAGVDKDRVLALCTCSIQRISTAWGHLFWVADINPLQTEVIGESWRTCSVQPGGQTEAKK